MRGWLPKAKAEPKLILVFPEPKVAMNGSCLLAPGVLLAAGAMALIWRVDLGNDTRPPRARVWLKHDNMMNRPGEKKPEQPGVNGIRYGAQTGFLYYTSTSQNLMMRVAVDPASLEAVGLPEFVAGGRYWDDFVLDENAGVAYVTTHRENTIDRVVMAADGNRSGFIVAAGNPFTEVLVGPSSGVWRRGTNDYGRVAYFTTDGGTAAIARWRCTTRQSAARNLPVIDRKSSNLSISAGSGHFIAFTCRLLITVRLSSAIFGWIFVSQNSRYAAALFRWSHRFNSLHRNRRRNRGIDTFCVRYQDIYKRTTFIHSS